MLPHARVVYLYDGSELMKYEKLQVEYIRCDTNTLNEINLI